MQLDLLAVEQHGAVAVDHVVELVGPLVVMEFGVADLDVAKIELYLDDVLVARNVEVGQTVSAGAAICELTD